MKHTKYSNAQIKKWEKVNPIISILYQDYYKSTYYYVLRIVKYVHDAEQVTNDVFDKIRRFYDTFDETKSGIGTWIRTVTNSVILDFFRTNHQDYYQAVSDFANDENDVKNFFQFVAPKQDNADQKILTAEKQEHIDKAFYELKPEYRRVASMYFIQELPYYEIADMLDVPMGTIKGMVNRSRTMLQQALKARKAETV